MNDLYLMLDRMVSGGGPLPFVVALAGGVLSAAGPCTPMRLAWLATYAAKVRRPYAHLASFTLGNVAGYLVLGLIGAMVFDRLFMWSRWLYIALGVVAVVLGLRQLLEKHEHACETVEREPRSYGATFLSGLGFAWLFQPCCTPIVVAAVAAIPSPVRAAAVLACFGVGHAMPAWVTPALGQFINRSSVRAVSATVLGGLSVAVGLYYLVLA